ncbi:voltage-dependent anion channel protein 2 [Zea mays]|uniref:Outer mitochondrial membrane protein porin n=1 Tax=Zea mays TaxID=4577 RepID=Q9SPD7_MAIZE|nr:voltage-dependent anion channel protein 2 [Zea mays]AAD56653.1 voltage-dependent anion channel protein 2 [Zea mays]ACF85067.1 unknown [Zea mays]ACG34248.1 outer mitochondrial membrane protein porin [Zea mays]AQK88005.1 voltage-dependent anion channel protein2 [Zea mays]|eukprot:NP_001104949.1 voltage-dependent anion channel protein 2 [Zea mays]
MAAAGPGLYSEIGKKARDLLYKDYHTDQKFTLTTYAANGAAITAASTRKDEAIFNEIQSQLKHNNVTVDVKATSESNVITTITVHELGTPGLKAILCVPFPYQKSAKAELQYLHHHAGVAASVGLNANPVVNLSGVFGTKAIAVGADAAFDTSSGDLTKYNAGLSYTTPDFVAAATLNNKGDNIAASYYHSVSPTTAVGGELSHSFSTNGNTITFGTQHALDPLTTVKARFNNYGMASALIQHEWRPKSLVTISTEVDTKAIEKSSKVGLSLVLKP